MTQRQNEKDNINTRCELLSNLYLCIGWHSVLSTKCPIFFVVNCFQICIFVSDDTAQLQMWFEAGSCELLSNLYLCIGWHSVLAALRGSKMVVNCFQICIFVSDDTALIIVFALLALLWIAFKFVSLYRMTQHTVTINVLEGVVNCFQICIFVSDDTAISIRGLLVSSCELLSNLYLCIGWHSGLLCIERCNVVVNCFQICIFVSDDTAKRVINQRLLSCELLSNLYLCIGWHS